MDESGLNSCRWGEPRARVRLRRTQRRSWVRPGRPKSITSASERNRRWPSSSRRSRCPKCVSQS